jgi:hypothetical protein
VWPSNEASGESNYELVAAAKQKWEQFVIEEALGKDAAAVLPEAIRLVELRARVSLLWGGGRGRRPVRCCRVSWKTSPVRIGTSWLRRCRSWPWRWRGRMGWVVARIEGGRSIS